MTLPSTPSMTATTYCEAVSVLADLRDIGFQPLHQGRPIVASKKFTWSWLMRSGYASRAVSGRRSHACVILGPGLLGACCHLHAPHGMPAHHFRCFHPPRTHANSSMEMCVILAAPTHRLCMHLVHAVGAMIEETSWAVAGQVEMCWWTCGGMTVWHHHCCKVAGLAGSCCGQRTYVRT